MCVVYNGSMNIADHEAVSEPQWIFGKKMEADDFTYINRCTSQGIFPIADCSRRIDIVRTVSGDGDTGWRTVSTFNSPRLLLQTTN